MSHKFRKVGGSSASSRDDPISGFAKKPSSDDRPQLYVLKLHVSDKGIKDKALEKVNQIPGVYSVEIDENGIMKLEGKMRFEYVMSILNTFGRTEILSDERLNISMSDLMRLEFYSGTSSTDFAGKSTTRALKTECILVFACSDQLDEDEASLIEAISKELQKREVTPMTYYLSGRDHLDADMLYRSSVGIMVLSNSYAHCRQSLDHFVSIMEHWKTKNAAIIPVYFKVALPDICELEGRFEAAFLQYFKWKPATSIDGYEWTKETQVKLVHEVVRNACVTLYLKNSYNLLRILELLNHSQPPDADIVGIWGMVGVGKTSIAREIFGTLAPQYDLCYFLQDFDLQCQTRGLRRMRDDFYSKVFEEEKLSIDSSDIKPSFMRDWFQKKTILVVLDDVTNARDAEAVVGGFGWFSHGHRIILTSRRKQVLIQCKVKEPYKIQNLSEFESLSVCKQYINGESRVIPELIKCSSGIPLALNVLGSSVSKQLIKNMMEHLHSLRRNPPTQIQEAFRRSFDGLDENEKNMFLDLACFFKGEDKDHVVQLLDACGFRTYLGICDLIDESLINLWGNTIEIPILFQDIARFIVHEEDENPCERSRLWDSKDIADVLTNNSGTETIEGIFLDAFNLWCELSPSVFSKMYRLRLLKIYCSVPGKHCQLSLHQGLDTLPSELRLLHWENYPLEYLPQRFNPENLVELNMPYSSMEKLWEGKKNLEKLKKIKLSHSRKLTDILMLSEALNLKQIDLEGCTSLVDVSTSIPICGKLVSLSMRDCSRLRNLPAMVDLTSLELLNLSGCSELEEIQDFAPNLKELYLAETAIRELPLSINNLTKLVMLDLEYCRKLKKLPFDISNSRSNLLVRRSGCTSLRGCDAAAVPSESNRRTSDQRRFPNQEEKDLVEPVPSTLPSSSTTLPPSEPDLTPAAAAPVKAKYRHEYYQKPEEVVVTVFAEEIPKQNVNVYFGKQILSVVIDVPGEEAYHLQPRLFGKIIPEKCRYEVLSTKVEIRLAKAEVIRWAALEHGKGPAVFSKPNVSLEVSQRPAYPSSKKVKDWDKLEAEMKTALTEFAEKAKEAFVDDDYDVSVDLYTKAIDLDPNCADFFADRAQANIKLDNFTEAVADANKAIELDPSLIKAYLRKGTACMKLEEYRTAKTALEKGASIASTDSKFKKLIDECNLRISEEEKDLVEPVPSTLPSSFTTLPVSELDLTPAVAAPVKPKYRHEYYQKPEEVVVSVFAKGIPKQNVNVDFGVQIMSVVIDVPGEEEAYHLQPRLFGKIIPDKCRYEVLSTKVEIRLAKADIITWAALEHGKGPAVLPKPNVSLEVSQRPAYPSSKKVKDLDKLEAEMKKQEKDEKLDEAMEKFFHDIYQTADEDMRRAMGKSFVESNETVLSTNWKEVGTKKVESTPPDGMELKKWEI